MEIALDIIFATYTLAIVKQTERDKHWIRKLFTGWFLDLTTVGQIKLQSQDI